MLERKHTRNLAFPIPSSWLWIHKVSMLIDKERGECFPEVVPKSNIEAELTCVRYSCVVEPRHADFEN